MLNLPIFIKFISTNKRVKYGYQIFLDLNHRSSHARLSTQTHKQTKRHINALVSRRILFKFETAQIIYKKTFKSYY